MFESYDSSGGVLELACEFSGGAGHTLEIEQGALLKLERRKQGTLDDVSPQRY